MSGQEQIEPIPNYGEIDESELKQIIYGLPIDPRANRIMLTCSSKDEDDEWALPKSEVESHENQEVDVHREVYEQAGVRGQVIGCVGSFYECGKKGKPKSHIKVYELQIDELIKKWPGKKKKNRSWFTYDEVLTVVADKPYLIESLKMSSLSTGIQQ